MKSNYRLINRITFFSFSLAAVISMTLTCVGDNSNSIAAGDKYRNYYEIFVRSFYDSNGDGIGDLNGVREKLDYLNDGETDSDTVLGIDGIWLMPVMPSPSYHKYDVTDYYNIDPQYGSMEDFEELISECDKRGVSVIIDLVLNHTSAKHPWFLSAIGSIGTEPCGSSECSVETLCREHNPFCGYYNFTQEIPGGGYHTLGMPAGWAYQGVFWDQMPDLNLANEDVKNEILKITKYWIDKGVSGFRLDAVTQFFNENTSENVEFLKWFYNEAKKLKEDIYIVSEAWTTGGNIESYYASYSDSFFNFPYSDSTGIIVDLLRKRNGERLATGIAAWQQKIKAQNPAAIDAVFISNHDMARSSGFLMRNPVLQKMCASLYLMMPGNPFIYYGEEIGMTGSGIDENKRQPMVWSVSDSVGITRPPDAADQKQSLDAGVAEQLEDDNSLLRFYQKALRIKKENPEIARGDVEVLSLGNKAVCAYSCTYNGSTVYVLHNLSDSKTEISLLKSDLNYSGLRAYLNTDGGSVSLDGEVLVMPPYSTAIIK